MSTVAAEFTNGSAKRPATLVLNLIADGRRSFIESHVVANKREARALAVRLGATPWNF